MVSAPQPITGETLNKLYWERRQNPITKYTVISDPELGSRFKIEPRFDVLHGKKRTGYNDYLELYYENFEEFDFEPRDSIHWDFHFEDYLNDFRWHRAISDPRHRHFEGYERVRMVAAITGRIIGSEEPIASMPEMERKLAMDTMAKQAASTMKWQSFWRGITNFLTLKWRSGGDIAKHRFGVYGEEHLGAAKLYEKLVKKQGKFIWDPFSWITLKFRHPNFGLPPVEESAFSSKDMAFAMYVEKREDEIGMEDAGNRLKAEGLLLARQAASSRLQNVSELQPGDSRHAIDLGHTIIENLKRIDYGMSDREMGSRENQRRELEAAEYAVELCTAYQTLLAGLAHQNPAALQEPVFAEAQQAMGQLSYTLLQQAEKAYLRDRYNPHAEEQLEALMEAKQYLPDEFQYVEGTNQKMLIKKIEKAMEYAAEYQGLQAKKGPGKVKGVELTPEAASRVQASIEKMHGSIDGYSARINGVGGAASKALQQEIREINALNANRASESVAQAPSKQTRTAPAMQ